MAKKLPRLNTTTQRIGAYSTDRHERLRSVGQSRSFCSQKYSTGEFCVDCGVVRTDLDEQLRSGATPVALPKRRG